MSARGSTGARITLRPATPADVGLILGFIRELADYEKGLDQVVATEATLREQLFGAGIGRGPTAECLIGEVDGVAQGFAVYFHNFSTWKGRAGLYLEDLFVRPAARGLGLGEALFRAVATVAVERGCPRMDWMVLDWNEPAIGFYKRLGAEAMDEWTVFRLSGAALSAAGRSG
jgi:GNAT superfamily N-acetyltransferase